MNFYQEPYGEGRQTFFPDDFSSATQQLKDGLREYLEQGSPTFLILRATSKVLSKAEGLPVTVHTSEITNFHGLTLFRRKNHEESLTVI